MRMPVSPDYHEATIAAIATPPGAGGIGIIRLSGPASLAVLQQLFWPHDPKRPLRSHQLSFGHIRRPPPNGAVIDEVLAVFMRAPRSYTREDVAEIHCHGSYHLLDEILALILSFPGTRLAEPGEFTKRAFLNGRIDLTAAEAVFDLLKAKTRTSAHLAVDHLRGGLYEEIEKIRKILVAIRATVELAIDFPDEDLEILDGGSLREQVSRELLVPLTRLLSRAEHGKVLREGLTAVILGRPNVGKSSLLNRLLGEERAIVTEIPGTTRDTIEEYLDIRSLPIRIVDTAGIREDADTVEELGIIRARKKLADSDLVLLVLDGAAGIQDEDQRLFTLSAGKKCLILVNKIDRMGSRDPAVWQAPFADAPLVFISASTGEGLDALREAIYVAAIGDREFDEPEHAVPNARHAAALSRTLQAVRQIEEGLLIGLSPELLAIDLQAALDHLGEIVGLTSNEDLLDTIFAEFCLGK